MATENEQIIIDVVPEIDLTALAKKYMTLKEDLKKLKASIREELKLEFGVKRPSAKDVNAIARDVITEAKKLEKEQSATELAELRQRISTKHTYRKAEIAKIRADREAEARAEIASAKTTSKILADLNKQDYNRDKAQYEQATISKADFYRKFQNSLITESLKREQKFYSDMGKIRVTEWKKAQAEVDNLAKQKAPIGALGVQVAPSGAFSSLATKQTYSSVSDFKANASMEATARAAIAQSAKLGKQAAHEFNNSFLGSFMSGSSFGHKVGTTMQYMLAGAGIAGGAMAFVGLKDAIVEADKALGMFNAILFNNEKSSADAMNKSKELQTALFDLGTTYGGQMSQINESALALGRAGIEGDKLAESVKAVSQIALISGDSLEVVTDVFISWKTLYPDVAITKLADAMTTAANATKASVDDFKTISNYMLTAGQQAGLTSDALIALEASWVQIGKSSSTAGTEGRRFFEQISRGSDEVKKAWSTIGINVDNLSKELAKGGTAAEAAMVKLFDTLKGKSKSQIQEAVKGIKDVLDVATIQSMYGISKSSVQYQDVLDKILNKSVGTTNKAAGEIALTYEKMWERLVNTSKQSASIFEQAFTSGIMKGFMGSTTTAKDFDEKLLGIKETMGTLATAAGESLGTIAKFLLPIISNLDTILLGYAAFKAAVLSASVISTISGIATQFGLVTTAVNGVTVAITAAAAKQAIFNSLARVNPWIALATAIAGGVAWLYEYNKELDKVIAKKNSILANKDVQQVRTEITGMTRDAQVVRIQERSAEAYLEQQQILKNIKILEDSRGSAQSKALVAQWNASNKIKVNEKQLLEYYERQNDRINKRQAGYQKLLNATVEARKAEATYNTNTAADTNSITKGLPSLSDKDSGKAAREAQRLAQDALDAEIQAIREKYATIERNEAKANKLTEARKKELEKLEAYEKSYATDKAKGIDDWLEKSRKAHVEALDKETALYELANKANKEAAKKASITLADNRILQATNEYTKASAELSKAKLEAELLYNEELEKGTSEAKAKALQEEAVAKATTEYQNKILELDKKRTQERIKLQQDTSSMLEENKTQQQAITDEYHKFLGYSERALELEQLKANVAKETRSIYREQESALASKYAGDKDVDTNAQTTVDDSVIQKLSAINDKELQRLALMEYQAEFQKAFASGLDEQAINLDGILAKYQAIADKISNLELKVDIEIAKDGFEPLTRVEKYISGISSAMSEGGPKVKDYSDELSKLSGTARDNLQKDIDAEEKRKAKNKALNDQILKFSSVGLQTVDKVRKAQELAAEAEKKYSAGSKESNEANLESISNQAGAYGALAGAAAGFFEEGSKGAKAMQAIQATLGIINGISAITRAWSDPYPLNLVTVPLTTAAVLPMIGQLASLGGSGGVGGYSQPQSITDVQAKQENYQSDTEAIISRLDRSNELLEIIGKTGSAAQVDVLSKKIAYDRTLGDISYSVAQDVVLAEKTEGWRREAVAKLIEGASKATGVSLGVYTGIIGQRIGKAYLDTTALAGNIEASVKYINYLSENIDNINFEGIDRFERSDVTGWVDDILEAVSEFSTGLIDNINALKDASIDFQDTFDSLTGTATYSTQRLQKAYGEVNALVGDSTLPEYLARQIENIEKLYLSQSDIQTLLIQDTSAIIDQEAILTRISGELGVAFEGGAKDALDYLESINLVAEAMVASRENIESFTDSFLSESELLNKTALEFGVSVPQTISELMATFETLKSGVDGLTEAELGFLNQNKSLIDQRIEEEARLAKEAADEQKRLAEEQARALDEVTKAQKAYIDSLRQTVNTGFMQDMMLDKITPANNTVSISIKDMVSQQTLNNTNQSQQISILYEIVKTLKDQLKEMRYGTTQGIPA